MEAEILAFAMYTPGVVKSVGDVEKRRVYFLNTPTGANSGTELCALGTHTKTLQEVGGKARGGLTQALSERDKAFGDYREREKS